MTKSRLPTTPALESESAMRLAKPLFRTLCKCSKYHISQNAYRQAGSGFGLYSVSELLELLGIGTRLESGLPSVPQLVWDVCIC